MKQITLFAAATLTGFVGGVLGTLVTQRSQRSAAPQIIRAQRFELLDGTGKPIAFWGIDKRNYAVLAFGGYWPDQSDRKTQPPTNPLAGLDDPRNHRVSIGVIDEIPFLALTGADGKARVRLDLSSDGKPALLMGDEREWRMSLGVEQSDTPGPQDNDWTLDFGLKAGQE
jgi:hypothetical protein